MPVSRWSRCSITVCFTPSEVDSLDSLEGERIDPFSLGTQPGPRSGNRQISRHGTRGDLLSASAVCRNCRTAESVRFGESSDTATRKVIWAKVPATSRLRMLWHTSFATMYFHSHKASWQDADLSRRGCCFTELSAAQRALCCLLVFGIQHHL